jgi:hypothetical protein
MNEDSVPMTPLAQGAHAMHEMLVNYTLAGFTREEAMELVIAQMSVLWNRSVP